MSLSRFFRRAAWDDERARELDAHLAIETDENIARGMSARRGARGGAPQARATRRCVREEIYQMNTDRLARQRVARSAPTASACCA